MPDELKSALELALEKLEGQDEMGVEKLSDQQKEAIGEARKIYKARIAEEEINGESRVRKAMESGAYDQVQEIQQQMAGEKARLNREMEKKIERIRRDSKD